MQFLLSEAFFIERSSSFLLSDFPVLLAKQISMVGRLCWKLAFINRHAAIEMQKRKSRFLIIFYYTSTWFSLSIYELRQAVFFISLQTSILKFSTAQTSILEFSVGVYIWRLPRNPAMTHPKKIKLKLTVAHFWLTKVKYPCKRTEKHGKLHNSAKNIQHKTLILNIIIFL